MPPTAPVSPLRPTAPWGQAPWVTGKGFDQQQDGELISRRNVSLQVHAGGYKEIVEAFSATETVGCSVACPVAHWSQYGTFHQEL